MSQFIRRNAKNTIASFRTFTFSIALFLIVIGQVGAAQTYTVLHTFTGPDGAYPEGGLTAQGSSLYGTTVDGGDLDCNCGTVFKLSRAASGWVLSSLHKFQDLSDGAYPVSRVVVGPDGALYSSTLGSNTNCCGTIFRLQPPATFCRSTSCAWTERTIFSFSFGDGGDPSGDLTFDTFGNIYGTTIYGGRPGVCADQGCGTVYELTQASGVWTANTLYKFYGINDGGQSRSGVIFDGSGNLYGTAPVGRDNSPYGVVYELSPSGSGWVQRVIYSFHNSTDGSTPYGGLIFDQQGNLYGATTTGGSGGGGTVFQMSASGGNWSLDSLASLTGSLGLLGPINGPIGKLVMDSSGSLYGASTQDGAHGLGNVFKLTPLNGGWTYTSLHDFTGGGDGAYPTGGIAMDESGKIYGTTLQGGDGTCNCGVAFEVAQ